MMERYIYVVRDALPEPHKHLHRIPGRVLDCRAAALRYRNEISVPGSFVAPIFVYEMLLKDGEWHVPLRALYVWPSTDEDRAEQVRMNAIELACSRLLKMGVDQADLDILLQR